MAFNLIAKKEYYSIGEVCQITGLKPHVLRYWETQFWDSCRSRIALNRAYRRREIEMVQLVKELLYEKKYTIEGARRRLEEMKRTGGEKLEVELEEAKVKDTFETLADDLAGLVAYIEAFRRGRRSREPRGRGEGPAPAGRPAPLFPDDLDWLHVARPLTWEDLRGRVVVLDFWTYG